MTYEESISYLYASQPAFHLVGAAAYKPGLDNTYALMNLLDNPHRKFRSIHVAGTNGKGSCSHLIAAALQSAGLKVGLYTSPHLVDFRERIRINGQMIAKEWVAAFVTAHLASLDSIKPSFFETSMAMAFAYFAEQQVDIAVIEVGLGGRLDSTNIITPILSVITNIGMDHTEFLGDTLAKIAEEKAGIIKDGVPCVVGETHSETLPVFLSKAESCNILGNGLETSNCRIWIADQCGYLRRVRERDVPLCELHGIYQEKNMQTAYVALRVLASLYPSVGITKQAIREGFAHVCTLTGLRGRWEVLHRSPLVVCDTGHNSHGIRYVAQQLEQLQQKQPKARLRIVLGMVDDKDVEEVMRLLPCSAIYYFTQACTHRAIACTRMLSLWQQIHPHTQARALASVGEAVHAAIDEAGTDDIVFIGGSNYVVGEALQLNL